MENFYTPDNYYASDDLRLPHTYKMEPDPDGKNQQVAVIMTGKVSCWDIQEFFSVGLLTSLNPMWTVADYLGLL